MHQRENHNCPSFIGNFPNRWGVSDTCTRLVTRGAFSPWYRWFPIFLRQYQLYQVIPVNLQNAIEIWKPVFRRKSSIHGELSICWFISRLPNFEFPLKSWVHSFRVSLRLASFERIHGLTPKKHVFYVEKKGKSLVQRSHWDGPQQRYASPKVRITGGRGFIALVTFQWWNQKGWR